MRDLVNYTLNKERKANPNITWEDAYKIVENNLLNLKHKPGQPGIYDIQQLYRFFTPESIKKYVDRVMVLGVPVAIGSAGIKGTSNQYKQGGHLPKFQPGGLISSPEESEQYQYQRSVDNTNKYAQRRPLEEFNDSKLGKTLDWVDAGLDVVAMVPNPASPFAAAAGIVTGTPQALAAGKEWLFDMSKEGLKLPTLDQAVAMSKLIPTGGLWTKAGRKALLTKDGIVKGVKANKVLSKWIPNTINILSDKYELNNQLPKWMKPLEYFNPHQ